MRKIGLTASCLLFYLFSVAQKPSVFETNVYEKVANLQRISNFKFADDTSVNVIDSLEFANKNLQDYIVENCKSKKYLDKFVNTQIDTLSFKVVDAPDGKFRIYTWNSMQGGTMVDYCSVIHFVGAAKPIVIASDRMMNGEDVSNYSINPLSINTIKNKKGETHYLISDFNKLSGCLYYNALQVAIVKNNNLVFANKIFKIKNGKKVNMGIEIDICKQKKETELEDYLIDISSDAKSITCPVISNDGQLTKKRIYYTWNGNEYQFIKKE
jgi:hypothetical protein